MLDRIRTKDLVRITSTDGEIHELFLTKTTNGKEMKDHGRMVFRRYGERYFLNQLGRSASLRNRELFESRAKSRRYRLMEEDAANGSDPEHSASQSPTGVANC